MVWDPRNTGGVATHGIGARPFAGAAEAAPTFNTSAASGGAAAGGQQYGSAFAAQPTQAPDLSGQSAQYGANLADNQSRATSMATAGASDAAATARRNQSNLGNQEPSFTGFDAASWANVPDAISGVALGATVGSPFPLAANNNGQTIGFAAPWSPPDTTPRNPSTGQVLLPQVGPPPAAQPYADPRINFNAPPSNYSPPTTPRVDRYAPAAQPYADPRINFNAPPAPPPLSAHTPGTTWFARGQS